MTLHVESVGAGPPLVLLHGWAMHGGLFAPLLPELARNHRVHVVDLPGHGHSPPLASPTLDGMVDALAQHFAAAGPLRVLGWSLGGAVALRWAARRPSSIDRLALVATSPRYVAGADWPHAMTTTTLAQFGDELQVAYRRTLLRFLSLQVQGSAEGRATLGELRERLFERGVPSASNLASALAILATLDLREDATALRLPVQVITGGRDALTPRSAGVWLAQAIPGATHVDIPDAAHAPFLSHRAAFAAALAPLLAA